MLADRDLLLRVNLIHEHVHVHEGVSHTHVHAHEGPHEHEHPGTASLDSGQRPLVDR